MRDDPEIIRRLPLVRGVRRFEADCAFLLTRRLFRACGSPLEAKFLCGLLARHPDYETEAAGVGTLPPRPHIRIPEFGLPLTVGTDLRVWPQFVVGRTPRADAPADGSRPSHYRVDFLFALTRFDPISDRDEEVLRLAVELDGHSSHERTRAQAASDKSRDRYLVATGYSVFRFTSAEVFDDVDAVLRELEIFLRSRAVVRACTASPALHSSGRVREGGATPML